MGIKEVVTNEYTCDKCEQPLNNNDGIVFKGYVEDLKGQNLICYNEEIVLCWKCFQNFLPHMPVKEITVVKEKKIVYRGEDDDYYKGLENRPSEPYYGRDRNGGPSGPQVPPELPHFVNVVKKYSGVK